MANDLKIYNNGSYTDVMMKHGKNCTWYVGIMLYYKYTLPLYMRDKIISCTAGVGRTVLVWLCTFTKVIWHKRDDKKIL